MGLNVFSIGQAARGSAKNINSKRGPQPKKFGNRCSNECCIEIEKGRINEFMQSVNTIPCNYFRCGSSMYWKPQ